MKWNDSEYFPPLVNDEGYCYQSIPVLIKRKSGRYVVGYAQQFEDEKTEWIEDGRDGYRIYDAEMWAFIEE